MVNKTQHKSRQWYQNIPQIFVFFIFTYLQRGGGGGRMSVSFKNYLVEAVKITHFITSQFLNTCLLNTLWDEMGNMHIHNTHIYTYKIHFKNVYWLFENQLQILSWYFTPKSFSMYLLRKMEFLYILLRQCNCHIQKFFTGTIISSKI